MEIVGLKCVHMKRVSEALRMVNQIAYRSAECKLDILKRGVRKGFLTDVWVQP